MNDELSIATQNEVATQGHVNWNVVHPKCSQESPFLSLIDHLIFTFSIFYLTVKNYLFSFVKLGSHLPLPPLCLGVARQGHCCQG